MTTGCTIDPQRAHAKESEFFEYVFTIVEKNKSHHFITDSFEEYYFILKEAIAFFELYESYEKCAVLKKRLDEHIEQIPKSIDDAIAYLVKITPKDKVAAYGNFDEYSFAIELHPTIGKKMVDLWLLRQPDSPLKKYFEKEYQIKNPDEIANNVLRKYIQTVKAQLEEL